MHMKRTALYLRAHPAFSLLLAYAAGVTLLYWLSLQEVRRASVA
jgi:hypothetical protein